ncbi:tetratricopeptide repeat protein [Robiginitomaculum antarcticum]|uniref:tetratricopeptide repeat protein n=1 Tax=Robiginitomaculum antarcticum TaxID=437507 RepID=UPI00037F2F34|nr:tetratricopeptide repeat protein [Robiginitomaculum antarcticum]
MSDDTQTNGWLLTAPQTDNVSYESAATHYNDGNYAQALVYAKTAGSQGHVLAQLMAGQILRSGRAGDVNYVDAAQWYSRAAQSRNSDAMLALGDMALKGEGGLTPLDAQGYFKDAAAQGREEAMQALGVMYQTGRGVTKDNNEAAVWLAKAAAQGDAGAAKKRGDLLIETDPKAALEAYEQAAIAGDADAAYIAAIMYVENMDIRPNEPRSVELMHQAARSGHGAAMADYGLYVYQGLAGGSQAEAAQWFARSANSGDDQGKFLYAFTLAKGEGVTQDFEDAYYWLLKVKPSGIDVYDRDYRELKKRLEDNVDPAILDKAKARLATES